MATDAALSLLSRYEALVELSGEVTALTEIQEVGRLLARRLKYVADVFSWRYIRFEPSSRTEDAQLPSALVVDGFRGDAKVERIPLEAVGPVESELWRGRKARVLEGGELAGMRDDLPSHFRRADIVQLYVSPKVGAGELEGVLIFSKRRQPLNDLDVKFLSLAGQLLHDKVTRLWEEEKRRALETAYLEQEVMLRQSEKLATLGRLSAGIAHEVNNPIAAALRNAEQLASALRPLETSFEDLGGLDLTEEQRTVVERLRGDIQGRARRPPRLDPLTCADREDEVEQWLADRAVEDGWTLAPTLVAMGYDEAALTELSAPFSKEQLPTVVGMLAQVYSAYGLLEGIRTGAARVSEIVKSLKSYSYLDQAPVQSVDVHQGIEDTLVMMHDQLEDGIAVRRELDSELPRIEAYGRDLNQVWTNMIDNALYAMSGGGELTVRTYRDDPWIVVEIADTGSGIADDAKPHIFDPFFTTKPPGEGKGLGLNIVHNIVVQRHGGRIDVDSRPGATRFQVRLPPTLNRGDTTND